MDETWEDFEETTYTGISDVPFPFQTVLVKFLDQRAPLPGNWGHNQQSLTPLHFISINI